MAKFAKLFNIGEEQVLVCLGYDNDAEVDTVSMITATSFGRVENTFDYPSQEKAEYAFEQVDETMAKAFLKGTKEMDLF